MIFFANALGTITKIITEPVYQGSINTGRVVLIAPFPSSVQVTVAFTLPNGMNTQINLTKPNMANVDLGGRVLSPEGKTYNAWTYILNEVITAYAGEATVQFFVYDASGTVVTTYASTFDISPGVAPQLPITPTATIYTEILEALAALNARIDNITGEESGTSATFVNIVNELPDIPINKDGIYIVKNGDSIPQLYVYNKEVGVWIRLDEAVINVDAVEDATDTTKLYNVKNIGLHAFINDKWTLLATAETVGVVNQTAQNALTAANQAQEVANAANATAENAKTVANEAMEKVNSVKGGLILKGNISSIENLPPPSAATLGYLYNVSNPFTTTSDFVEGAGKKYPANENVAIVQSDLGVYKYDVFSGLIDLSGYQKKLVSGENIKTINNQPILGSGNLDITGIKLLEITPNADGVSGTLTQETYNEIVNGFANTIITINGYPNNLFKPLFKDENERYIYVLEQNLTVNNETRSLLMYIGVSSNLTWSVIGEEEFRSVYAINNNDGTISLNVGNEQFNLINSLKTVNNQSLIGSGNISIPKGETGAQGPIGPQGVGITNITTGTVSQANGYTLTQVIFEKDNNLSNSINVQAKNGENGLPGADGTIVEANPTEEATANLNKIKIANVVYEIPSGGGNITVEVEELPTENIDASKIYMVAENAEVYCKLEDAILVLSACVQDAVGVTPEVNYKVVTELPTTGEVTDLQTFSVIYCYIYNNVPYVYGNAGAGNMWIPVSTLFAEMGVPVEDKGRTYNIFAETEIGLYVYYDQIAYVWNNAWSKLVSNSSYICEINASNGEIGTYTEEEFNNLIKNIDNAVIRLITNTGTFYIRNFFINSDISALATFINIGNELYILALSKDTWMLTEAGELAKLNGDNIFQGDNEFYGETYFDGNVEMSNANFSGNVDFSNATVTGLPSGGGKTKITLAELQAILYDSFNHEGKLIQIVAKPTADIMLYHCNRHISLVPILRNALAVELTVSYLSNSELRITTWSLQVHHNYAYYLTAESV